MNKVVFLDRDGVLCKEKSYVASIKDLEIFSYARDAVQLIKELGYKAIVITNQSGVARNLIDEKELLSMNEYLLRETGVDDIYYCPHLPPLVGQEEELPYIRECNCRKPKIGLLVQAQQEHDLTLDGAFFVGDRATDVLTGQAVGAKAVLLESGYGTAKLEQQVIPDYTFNDLLEFAEWLKNCL